MTRRLHHINTILLLFYPIFVFSYLVKFADDDVDMNSTFPSKRVCPVKKEVTKVTIWIREGIPVEKI